MSFAAGIRDHRFTAALLASCTIHAAAMMVAVPARRVVGPPPASVLEVSLDRPRPLDTAPPAGPAHDVGMPQQVAGRTLAPREPGKSPVAAGPRSRPRPSKPRNQSAPLTQPAAAPAENHAAAQAPRAALPASNDGRSSPPAGRSNETATDLRVAVQPPPAVSEAHADIPGQEPPALPPDANADLRVKPRTPDGAPTGQIAALSPTPARGAISAASSADLLQDYGVRISQALGRYKEYPRIAQLRGWQGSVTMRLRVTPSGHLVDAELYRSSGHDTLDRQALAMASKAQRLPVPPDGLRDGDVVVLVPIVFRLEH